MYITFWSFHQRHTIKNFVWGELKRYVRYNMEEKHFKSSERASLYVCVTVGSRNMSSPSYLDTSHIHKLSTTYCSGNREKDSAGRRRNFQPFARRRGNVASPRHNPHQNPQHSQQQQPHNRPRGNKDTRPPSRERFNWSFEYFSSSYLAVSYTYIKI